MTARPLDPLNVNGRLYQQMSYLLDQVETDPAITFRERLAAVIAIGRIQVMFVNLRKESSDDGTSGSAVRKYATAFKNAGRGRKKIARSSTPAITDQSDDDDWGDDDPAA